MTYAKCKRGHERTPENTYRAKGWDVCRLCRRDAQERRRGELRERHPRSMMAPDVEQRFAEMVPVDGVEVPLIEIAAMAGITPQAVSLVFVAAVEKLRRNPDARCLLDLIDDFPSQAREVDFR